MPYKRLTDRTLLVIEGIPYCRTWPILLSWKISERLLVSISMRKRLRETRRKVAVNPEKGGTFHWVSCHLSPKFSREFGTLVRVKSHFSLSKVGLYCL